MGTFPFALDGLVDGYTKALIELDELFEVGHFAGKVYPWDRWPGMHYIERAFLAVEHPITFAHAAAIAPLLWIVAGERIDNYWTDAPAGCQ